MGSSLKKNPPKNRRNRKHRRRIMLESELPLKRLTVEAANALTLHRFNELVKIVRLASDQLFVRERSNLALRLKLKKGAGPRFSRSI
jgi:hypothetical protein